MASILTNTSAMIALQTLKSTNKGMAQVQNQISTGMKVATSKDNASTWAIAQTMRSDVGGFKSVKSNLDMAAATVNVARTASESVANLLNTVKEKIVEAQSDSVDRAKIQSDITALKDQIQTVVNTAQFNGVNLLKNGDDLKVLSSLDRDGDAVTSGSMTVNAVDLRTGGLERQTGAALDGYLTWDDGAGTAVTEIGAAGTADLTVGTVDVGNVYKLTIGNDTKSFIAGDEDTADSMAAKIAAAFTKGDIVASVAAGTITFTNNGAAAVSVDRQAWEFDDAADMTDGLGALSTIDVETDHEAALAGIEALLKTTSEAAASFGSAQQRIEMQQEFMGKLIDSMNSGIGTMVDADMEETSARLQALQVQQQLGIQALSMANQAPQSVLSLFR